MTLGEISWPSMLFEAVTSSIETMLLISVIVIPILVGLELLRDSGWLKKITGWFSPWTGKLFLPGEAAFPMVVSFTVGLQYGAGVIMQVGREGAMNKEELTITCILIGITHSLIEETVIFAGIGANGPIILVTRVLAGILFASLYVLFLKYFGTLPLRASK